MALEREFFGLLRGLTTGVYPTFVTRGKLGPEIPAFYYHRVTHGEFESHLCHLQRNGYESLIASEHLAIIKGLQPFPRHKVLLTFDDGLSDLYDVAFPLLQRYRMRAVAFIVPARVGLKGAVKWDQLRRMHDSELIDIQSHSLHHAAIPISPRAIDFYHPGHRFAPWELPVSREWMSGISENSLPWGASIFEYDSRLGDGKRYFPHPLEEQVGPEHVRAMGGKAFFTRRGWRRQLFDLQRKMSVKGAEGFYETSEEQERAIRIELVESKERIEAELHGKGVAHFAYPWSQVGAMTRKLLSECGYDSAYGGLWQYRARNTAVSDVFQLGRLSGDFVPCLPGEGRKPFLSVLTHKIRRRLAEERSY